MILLPKIGKTYYAIVDEQEVLFVLCVRICYKSRGKFYGLPVEHWYAGPEYCMERRDLFSSYRKAKDSCTRRRLRMEQLGGDRP